MADRATPPDTLTPDQHRVLSYLLTHPGPYPGDTIARATGLDPTDVLVALYGYTVGPDTMSGPLTKQRT